MVNNHVTIVGRIARHVQVRYTKNGTAVAGFAIGVEAGAEKKSTHWIDCVACADAAESIGRDVAPGSRMRIDGRLSKSCWEKDGTKVWKTEVVVEEYEVLGGNRSGSGGSNQALPDDLGIDDDIPF